jgi:UDP:flavonoid glycosyltransferase YjiC (YdhE family)
LPANCVFAADLISYDEACRVASVVVCNGGAPAVYAATAHGVPAIGIASNFDQVLNLAAMRRRHESVTAIDVRSLHADAIRRAIESALDHSTSDPRAPAPDKRLPASVDRARAWIDALAASTVEQVYKRRANERRRSGGRRPNS